ncbi:MAG: polysaccharide biosynthesis protein [Bryobacterales bacterium]|nr:polysaccharide biosynthesis protein [Bryobacterales bacterium]
MHNWLMRHRRLPVSFIYTVVFALSVLTAYLLRFEYAIPQEELTNLTRGMAVAVAVKMLAVRISGLDRGWLGYAGLYDLPRIVATNIIASVVFGLVTHFMVAPAFARSVFVIDFLLALLATSVLRFAFRIYKELVIREISGERHKWILIYGAGAAGMTLLREVNTNPKLGYRVLGFLDDDPKKRNEVYNSVKVLGTGRHAARLVEHYRLSDTPVTEIVIAMRSATGAQMQEILANCRAAAVPCKTVPSVGELLSGKVLPNQIREVSVLDLLGRAPVDLDERLITQAIRGKVVLVTGAGGSIGSELCRQVARHRPRRIIGLDQAESDLFRIDLEIKEKFPAVEFVPQIANICDKGRVDQIFRESGIHSVFHAAAYKHVPLMEAHPLEAVRNNVMGTHTMAEAARHYGVRNFLMISSDKAVNPTNVMGATKRAAELIISSMPTPDEHGTTRFVSVRFGNVLNSNGSVIPLFKAQIAAGGPLTVTHPDVQRYFMTIPEAVQLVLQASTMGRGSEVYLLDMGEPVRILDLAKNMIRLSGKVPDEDIEIRITGLRPGEKLFEELMTSGENIQTTYHPKILIFCGRRLSRATTEEWLDRVQDALRRYDEAAVVGLLNELAPEYQPSDQWIEAGAVSVAAARA